MTDVTEVKDWLASRKREALNIDPKTAEVMWCHGHVLDPYGVEPDLTEEEQVIGRVYFARSPGSNVWVSFGDLPDEIRSELWEQHKSTLAFPAGLLDFDLEFLDDFAQNGAT
jgi:hypothetical protein